MNKSNMDDIVVPWDGMIDDPTFARDMNKVGNGLYHIKGNSSSQSYCCVVDTRSNTWFNLDYVDYRQTNDDQISTISEDAIETAMEVLPFLNATVPIDHSNVAGADFRSARELPILPPFLDTVETEQKARVGDDVVMFSAKETKREKKIAKKDDGEHYVDLRDKLNNIIDSHNLITGEIEGLTHEFIIDHIDKV